ncbi:hypothetical protein DSO57_1039789 [Entomophthora muscae]|uniref:Uncharacterized protein n=1 Tax=Entomophthora muscae TaxID=34485 RepID=A0ACC2UJ23_9FUNG|nr:hypothetical protein DSO57_1039789 [Entomophthora muscae]
MWHRMKPEIEGYLSGCKTCGCNQPKRENTEELLQPLQIAEVPWKSVTVGYIVELPNSKGFNAIFVIVNCFTKMAHFIPITTKVTAKEIATLFRNRVFMNCRLPQEVVSDRGPQFTSKFCSQILKDLGIKILLSTAYHPQSNRQTKRVNQVLEQYLQCYINSEQNNWVTHLPMLQFAYNNQDHRSTGMSPFKANYRFNLTWDAPPTEEADNPDGHDWVSNIHGCQEECAQNLRRAVQVYKDFANKKGSPGPPIEVGDLVYLSAKNIKTTAPCASLSPQ